MYELNGKQYSQEQIEAAAKKSNMDVNVYIQKAGLKYIQNPIAETTGKELSQGQGAPVAEIVAPESMALQPEVGSLESQEISLEEKKNLPYNLRNYISSTTGDFSKNNVEKVANEIKYQAQVPIKEKILGGAWKQSLSNLSKRYLGEDGLGGIEGPAISSIKQKIGTTVEQLMLNIAESEKDFEQWQMSHESPEDRARVAKLSEEKIQKKKEGLKQSYKELNRVRKAIEEFPIITITGEDAGESFMNGISGLIGSGATVAESVVPAMGAALAGTVIAGPAGGVAASIATSNSMMMGDMITGYNTTKAKSLYPDLTEDEAIEKLIQNGESEFLKPFAVAVPAMGLEAVGIKGISKYFAAQKGLMKNLGGLMYAANGEGLTESFQAPLEEYNQLLAKGVDPVDAVPIAAQYFVDNFTKTYIEAAAGTLVFSGLGKAGKLSGRAALRSVTSLRRSVDGGKIESTINEIGDLTIKKINTQTPEAREAIQLKIKEKQDELKGYITRAASIMDFASDKNLEDINDLNELQEVYAQKVEQLHEESDFMPTEEYLDALDIYRDKYEEAKNKINNIAREVEETKNNAPKKQQEASKKAQELYEKVVVNEEISQAKKDQAKADIVSLFEPSVNRIVNKYRDRPGFNQMKEDLTSELLYSKSGVLGLIDTYNKSKNDSIGAYVNSFLERRGIAIADKLLGKDEGSQFMTDVTESKTIMSEEAADATIDTREQLEAEPKQKKIAEKINIGAANQSVFKEAAKKALGSRLPSVENEKEFKKALDDSFRTQLTTAVKNISGTRKAYERFLKENWKSLYDAIPQDVVNKRFEQFNEKVIDPKTGKQKRETMAEGTAAGKGVFKKRTDVTQQEFMDYMLAKGSTKGARKNALSEMLATQMGFDEVLDAIKDPEIDKKFKEIQEMQGNVVPENYVERIAKSIDRAINYLDNLQKNNGVLYSSFVIPELTIAATKAFLITVKNAIKAGKTFKQALTLGIKATQKYFNSKEDLDAVEKAFKDAIPNEEALSDNKNIDKVSKAIDKIIKAKLKTLTEVTLFEDLKNEITKANTAEAKTTVIENFITKYSRSIRTANKKNFSTNEQLLNKIKEIAPASLFGKNKIDLIPAKPRGFTIGINNVPITNMTFDTTGKSQWGSLMDGDIQAKQTFDNQSKRNFDIVIDELVNLKKEGNLEKALNVLKLWQTDQRSPLKLAGKLGIVFDKFNGWQKAGEMTNEHNPPVQHLVEKAQEFLENKITLQEFKDELSASTQNFVTKEFESNIPSEFKSKADPNRYKNSLSKNKNKFKDYGKSQVNEETNFINEVTESLLNETVEPVNEQEATSMSSTVNKMLERKKGIPAGEIISKATAKLRGAKKKAFSLIIPPSAEDFKGLLYALLGTGKQGDADMQFFENKIFRPLAKANHQLNAERQLVKTKWKNLVKNNKGILKTLRKESEYKFYNNDAAVRVWIWDKLGYEVPGINATDKKGLIDSVQNDPKLLKFAEELIGVPNSKESWLKPEDDWTASTIEMDLQEILSKIGRARIFSEYIENAKIIFSEDNLNKIEAAYGPKYREALEDMLYRIEKGKAREIGGNRLANTYLNWVRGSVAVTMFFNTRSALLQQLSIVNFTNWSDNNPIAQGKLILTKPREYAKYWATIFNSDWMKERRQGLKTDINESELADRLQGSKDPKKALLAYFLEKGFVMTKYGDNFAVATGGAAFLYNREQTYIKKGMSEGEAKKQAFLDFQELAEQTQQSSRQDLLSNQQVSVIGRLFLAFQNTPMQMARLTKKAALDLINGRGSKRENISRIAYYSTIQSVVFSYLQSALFAGMFADEDDEEDEKRIDKKTERAINTVVDGFLRGTGVGGAVLASTKNAIIKWYKENDKDWGARSGAVLLELANVSPPIGIKARKIYGAMENYKYNKKYLDKIGYDNPNHPMYGVAANLGSAAFNVPLDRVLTKITNIKAMAEQDTEAWQRIALGLGYNTWDLGIEDKELERVKAEAKKKGVKVPKSKFSPSFKKFGKKFN